MEAAALATIQDPSTMLQTLEQELEKSMEPVPRENEGTQSQIGADISGEEPFAPLIDLKEGLTAVKQEMKEQKEDKGKGSARPKPNVKLPHKAGYVDKWMKNHARPT